MMDGEKETATIEQELAAVEARYPGYLPFFYQKMQQGYIVGSSFSADGGRCGCFYGWLGSWLANGRRSNSLFAHTGPSLSTSMLILKDLGQDPFDLTPIEWHIRMVKPGETPEQSADLQTLATALEPYLSLKGESQK